MNNQANKPGKKKRKFARFRKGHHRMQERLGDSYVLRILLAVFGIIFVLVGLVLLFIPGPGLLFIILGLTCLCALSHRLAHYFDSVEHRIRTWIKKKRK